MTLLLITLYLSTKEQCQTGKPEGMFSFVQGKESEISIHQDLSVPGCQGPFTFGKYP